MLILKLSVLICIEILKSSCEYKNECMVNTLVNYNQYSNWNNWIMTNSNDTTRILLAN